MLSVAVFAGLMLIATLIHWDSFNHGHAPFVGAAVFFGWVIVYVVVARSPTVAGGATSATRIRRRRSWAIDSFVPA